MRKSQSPQHGEEPAREHFLRRLGHVRQSAQYRALVRGQRIQVKHLRALRGERSHDLAGVRGVEAPVAVEGHHQEAGGGLGERAGGRGRVGGADIARGEREQQERQRAGRARDQMPEPSSS